MEDNTDCCDELLMADGIKAHLNKSEKFADLSSILFLVSLIAGFVNAYTDFTFVYGWHIVVGLCYISYIFKSIASSAQIEALQLYGGLSSSLLKQIKTEDSKDGN